MRESQIKPYEHSDIKVRLLKLYLEQYISILGLAKGVTEVFVYDLFCGEGIYSNGKEGSPIIILRILSELYNRNATEGRTNVRFKCFFNDVNTSKVEKLRAYIEENKIYNSTYCSIEFSTLDYQTLKNLIVSQPKAKGQKSFLFIDPYGYKDINIKDLANFLSDSNTEVLLFSPTSFMFRFKDEATPDSLYNFLSEVLPDTKSVDGRAENGVDFIHRIRDGFGQKFEGRHYVDSFIITRDKNQFFALFFFTSHLYGFEKFLEAKWKVDEEEGRAWHPDRKQDLFSGLEAVPNTDNFEGLLRNFLAEKRSNVELHEFTITNRRLTTHTVAILKEMENQGQLKVEMLNGETKRKGAFYVGWSDVKSKTIKCNYSKK